MSEYSFCGDICTFFGRLNNVTNGSLGREDLPRQKKSRKNLYICVAVASAMVIIGLGVGLGIQKSEQGKIIDYRIMTSIVNNHEITSSYFYF